MTLIGPLVKLLVADDPLMKQSGDSDAVGLAGNMKDTDTPVTREMQSMKSG